jgi:hypothetical protein
MCICNKRVIFSYISVWLCIYPLLGKILETSNETASVVMQWSGKHASTTIELLLETVFSMWTMPRSYLKTIGATKSKPVSRRSNTSTVTLRVVGGDEKGSLKYETVKYDGESQWTRTRERLHWLMPAAYTKDRPVLSSERAPPKNKTIPVKQ